MIKKPNSPTTQKTLFLSPKKWRR